MADNPLIKQIRLNGTTYDISDDYARELAQQAVAGGLHYEIMNALPTAGSTYSNTIALIADPNDTGSYIEYFCVKTSESPETWKWEKVGTTKTDIDPSSWTVTVDSETHSHAVPALNSISYTPGGSFTLTNTKTALTNIAQTKTAADVTNTKTAAEVTGASYTPAGSVTPLYSKSAVTDIAQTKTAADITNTKTAADVTGASYTPAGTVTVDSHTHSNTLASAATGGVAYVYGGATANRVTGVTSSTYNNVAQNVSYANNILYVDTTTIKGVSAINSATTVTALSATQMIITNAAAQPGASFSGTAATITPGVSYSKATGVSYSKFTAASYSYVSGATFGGTAATITPAVSYSKVTGVSYSKFTAASYSKASPNAFTGSVATLTPSYSTAFSTAVTSTASAGKAGTYNVSNPL